MRKNILAAALLAPALALAPAAALAHPCKGHHHHHYHHKASKGAYDSSKSMQNDNQGSQDLDKKQDLNKDTNRSSGGTTY